jgi:hypothetical protein
MKPPPLPAETLRRILRVARLDGISLMVVASLTALVSLGIGDVVGMVVGVLVAIGGWIELSGRRQLLRGEADGMRRLVRAQLVVLNVILVYCARMLLSFDLETAMGALTSYTGLLAELGVDLAPVMPLIRSYLPLGVYALYGTVALAALIYQGGLAVYYRRRTATVTLALAARLRPAASQPAPNPEDLVT